jgi:hypothetical protein
VVEMTVGEEDAAKPSESSPALEELPLRSLAAID